MKTFSGKLYTTENCSNFQQTEANARLIKQTGKITCKKTASEATTTSCRSELLNSKNKNFI